MTIILFLASALAFLLGGLIFSQASTALHEIEAGILFIVAAVLLAGASIVDAVKAARMKLEAAIGRAANELRAQEASHQTPRAPIPTREEPDPVEAWINEEPPLPVEPPPIADDEELAETLFSQARKHASSGQRALAIEVLREIIRLYPRTAVAAKAKRNLAKSMAQ